MTKSELMPGPWIVDTVTDGGLAIFANHTKICDMPSAPFIERDEANARLIAAAPDLYRLLNFAVNWVEDKCAADEIRAALAKARAE